MPETNECEIALLKVRFPGIGPERFKLNNDLMKGDYHVFRLDTDRGLEDFASLLMKMN